MSRTLISACLTAMVVVAALAAPSYAQRFQPFIDPDYFHPDLQFFAPAEAEEYGGEPQVKTGWFAGYDRMYIYVSRPRGEASYTEGDFTWGNRYDIGYMTAENHGWYFSAMHIDGPNEGDNILVERLNRYNDTNQGGNNGGGGGNNNNNGPIFPAIDRNDGFTGERTYDQQISTNLANMVGFEINKVWRLEPLHHGSILEPFIGFRYNKFKDYTRRDQYQRFDDQGNPVPNLPNANVALDDATIEQFTLNQWSITNNMVGGQLGVRWYARKSRWLLDSEFRAFALQNFQGMNYVQQVETTMYDGAGTGSDVVLVINEKQVQYDHAAEFVWGMEIRAQAAYDLTRDISLRCGMNLLDYGTGVGRGNNFTRNSEDVLMVGFTFGITMNR
ncbi:MAG: hypothetical protein U0935_17885 [Pirellulales bacterium]